MHNANVTQLAELEKLYVRLAEVEAARERYAQSSATLVSELAAQEASRNRRHTLFLATSTLVVALLTAAVFHVAQSSIIPARSTAPVNQNAGTFLRSSTASADASPGQYRRAGTATTRQWGPMLVMPKQGKRKASYSFDPAVKQQQADLLVLGFTVGKADGYKGERTRRAIAEFRSLYLPDSGEGIKNSDLAATMSNYARMARQDAARYGIDTGTAAAIRLSSVRTGVDFSYLMKLAATESNFDPAGQAATSSASGLYQFTRDTWLNVIKKHGEDYGLVADFANKIDYQVSRSGYRRPIVHDDATYQHLLALRKNPRLSAIMAAESTRDHRQYLAQKLGREPTDTDLYFSHFLGPENAATFLLSREQQPDTFASDLFPEAAKSNQDIFHRDSQQARTVNEVYALFEEKYRTRRFD
jgi:soluble lytic murein transglycosylase-like protein